ncbi:anhydro-N-acetylmuramic acid kinase [bacterium]|nr:anhydro-N-acetylmuramic acid kinase [bacterium]MBU1990582.1 anhydro-N-acetylmuramic acid kinase [bacterium]
MSELYIGVMSGTSLDGIDIALCEIDALRCTLVASKEYPFEQALKKEILALIDTPSTLMQIGTADKKLGLMFADAINSFIQTHKIVPHAITAVGLHAQTLWHNPDSEFSFSMQLGDANTVSAKTGLQVVADFRRMDMANGGQGAPFAPAFHQFVFGSLEEKTAVLNIGGMANITILGEELKGWDTGPGNVLMDMWIQKSQNQAYDKEGAFSACGTLDEELLKAMLGDEYFQRPPPKSTGREYFNETWLAKHLPLFQTIKDEDIQRTLAELTAWSIANDVNKTDTRLLLVCGGGAKNSFLMQRLQKLCRCTIATSDAYGLNSDFLEAMAFAWLAYKRVHREEVNLKSVTGASKNSILGGIYG